MPPTVRRLVTALALLLALIAFVEAAYAQSTYGAVVGTVTDPSHALLPGATVTLNEVQTGVVRTSTSSARGTYEFLNLVQGRYQVAVELPGFQKASVEAFPVAARQTVRIDVEVQAGGLSEEVTVTDVAPLINTENPNVSGAVANRQLQELPFTFRTFNTSPVSTIAVLPEVQKGRARLLPVGWPDLPERGLGRRHLHRQRASQRHRERGQRRRQHLPIGRGHRGDPGQLHQQQRGVRPDR